MADPEILVLVSDIVAAHVSHNSVSTSDLPTIIRSVHDALAGLGQPDKIEPAPEPAVSIRSSIKADTITCLDCGRKSKMLKRHLANEHGLSPNEYRAKWNLPRDYPMVAPMYAERRRDLAKQIGLGRKPVVSIPDTPPAPAAPKRKAGPRKKSATVAE